MAARHKRDFQLEKKADDSGPNTTMENFGNRSKRKRQTDNEDEISKVSKKIVCSFIRFSPKFIINFNIIKLVLLSVC